MKSEPTVKERFQHIEGLRGLLALYVALGHLCSMADPNAFTNHKAASPPWLLALMTPFGHGHLAVAAFIAVSGYCLQMALHDGTRRGRVKDYRAWYGRRVRRIAPPYYAALAISIAVCYFVTSKYQGLQPWDQYLPLTWQGVVSHALMFHNLIPSERYTINGVLWSIAFEAQLYLLFPLFNRALNRGGRLWAIGLSIAIWGALTWFVPEGGKLYFWYVPLFVTGMAAAHLVYRPRKSGREIEKSDAFLAVTLLLLIGALVSTYWGFEGLATGDVLFGLGTAGLLAALSKAKGGRLFDLLINPFFAGLGGMSYSLYLMHHPFQQIWFDWRPSWGDGSPQARLLWLVLGIPFIFVCCGVFYLLFERPFSPRAKARMRARRKSSAENLERPTRVES